MGKLEDESRRRLRKGELKQAALAAIGFAGLLAVAAAAPNVTHLLKYLPNNKYRFGNQTKNALTRLSKEGLVRFVDKNGRRYAELTKKGRQHMATIAGRFSTPKPKRWDGRWRVVMFDVPEKRRYTRDVLRSRMRELGFLRLQDSAWVFPFDCEDIVELIKTDLSLGANVQYLIAEIGNDRKLREEFSLPLRS